MKFPSLKTLAYLIIVPIATLVAVALRDDTPTVTNSHRINHTPAHAFQAPLPLNEGYLWHPADSNRIIYQSFDGKIKVTHDNLAGVPEQWTVAESGANVNVAWVNDRAELWHAQMAPNGEFSLSPVRLAEPTIHQVTITPLKDGEVLVLWQAQAQFTRPLFYALLDPQGRPRFQGQLLPDVEHFAAMAETEAKTVLIAWTVAENPTLNTLKVPLENLRQSPALPLENPTIVPLDLAEGAWVNEIGLAGQAWVVWGVNQITALDQTHFFAVNVADPTTVIPLTWEDHRLRWLGHVRPTTNEPYITLTAYDDSKWIPILAKIEADGTLTIVQQWDIAADASAPEVWLEGGASWVRLNEWGELTQTIVEPH
jgi:hypothetical protein